MTESPASTLKPTSWAMERLGYSDNKAFMEFVRREGVPFIKLSARAFRFDEASVEHWIRKRTVGRVA